MRIFLVLSFCLVVAASAQSDIVMTGTSSITSDDVVELLQLTVLKCEFVLPEKESGTGYGLEYWTEDWRRGSATPIVVDEGAIGLGDGGKSRILMKFPDAHSQEFYISTSVNANSGRAKLNFEERGAVGWNLLSKTPLQIGKPIMVALRVAGQPHSSIFPPDDASLSDQFAFYRKHESLQIVAFCIRIREVP